MKLLDKDQPKRPAEYWFPELESEVEEEHTKELNHHRIRCKACLNELTNNTELLPVEGKINHFFTNPSGIGFDLQTYRSAHGASLGGTTSEYFSWFEGFAWQHAFCNRCHQHIGWYFSCDGNAGFYALIIDRLLLD